MFHCTLSCPCRPSTKFISNLHNTESDHSGVETKGSAHIGLGGGVGVEAHDEVVAGMVLGLMFCRGFREEEGTPVCEAADYAARGEDEGAGCACDSGVWLVVRRADTEMGSVLSDFGQVARPDLNRLSVSIAL